MSYPWVGAPTPFNGTNPDLGGDSRKAFLPRAEATITCEDIQSTDTN
jgi:hypothetical protein